MYRYGREMRERSVRGRLLAVAAALTALWGWLVVWQPRYVSDGSACTSEWYQQFGPSSLGRYGIFALEVAMWFFLFYVTLRGFTSMQKSPFRRPFRWRPLPPERE